MSMLDMSNELFPNPVISSENINPFNEIIDIGNESLFTLDIPTNEEVPTEVTENGDVQEIERVEQPTQSSPQLVMARCPIVINSMTDENGVLKKIVHAHIRGPIEDMSGYVPLIDTLNRADESFTFILHIQSGGGMVTTGSTIASAMIASRAHVITIAEGLCASAASLIWSSGDVCLVTDYAMFMYHMSSHGDMANSMQVADNAIRMVYYVKNCLMRNALKKGHITPDQHQLFCEYKKDQWISADEMREQIKAADIKTSEIAA